MDIQQAEENGDVQMEQEERGQEVIIGNVEASDAVHEAELHAINNVHVNSDAVPVKGNDESNGLTVLLREPRLDLEH